MGKGRAIPNFRLIRATESRGIRDQRWRMGGVRALRLNMATYQVSLPSPPNRTYKFPSVRLSRIPLAFWRDGVSPHARRHGIVYIAPLSSVSGLSSAFPTLFSLSGLSTSVRDVLPFFLLAFHTIRIVLHVGVVPVRCGLGTAKCWVVCPLVHT